MLEKWFWIISLNGEDLENVEVNMGRIWSVGSREYDR